MHGFYHTWFFYSQHLLQWELLTPLCLLPWSSDALRLAHCGVLGWPQNSWIYKQTQQVKRKERMSLHCFLRKYFSKSTLGMTLASNCFNWVTLPFLILTGRRLRLPCLVLDTQDPPLELEMRSLFPKSQFTEGQTDITRELVRNVDSQALPHTCWIRIYILIYILYPQIIHMHTEHWEVLSSRTVENRYIGKIWTGFDGRKSSWRK